MELQIRVTEFARALLLAGVMITLAARVVSAQPATLDSVAVGDSTARYELRLADGSVLVGLIVELQRDSVRVQLSGTTVTVARSAVQRVRRLGAGSVRDGEFWPEHPNPTRLLFSPTAFALQSGEAYYWNVMLFLHGVAVGVSDNFSIGGGFSLVPALPIGDNVFYLTPKYTVAASDRGAFGIGALIGYLPAFEDDDSSNGSWGLLYGVGTIGGRETSGTIGLGWGYAGGALADAPALTVGGQWRISRRVGLISENWFVSADGEQVGIISYGVRLLGEKLSVDLAFLSVSSDFFVPGIPWVGFTYRF